MATRECPFKRDSGTDTAELSMSDGCPFSKRRRLDDSAYNNSSQSRVADGSTIALTPLSLWPDDIIIHLLQFLDLQTLENFDVTCKRVHFFIRRDLEHLLDRLIPNSDIHDEIHQLITSRSEILSCPPRASFAYTQYMHSIYDYYHTIARTANPVKNCPRKIIHPEVDFDTFLPLHINLFRTSNCFYFSDPMIHIAHFWTIFWEYKRVKAIEPRKYRDIVAEWAWKRYSYRDILGVARFNGSYYSRLITSSLNCQRDALRMVLEIYKSRNDDRDVWTVKDGLRSQRQLTNFQACHG